MRSKHTHRGHCQRCGAIQAVSNAGDRRLAKHGYVVAGFGFFNGTCQGAERAPLENDRSYLDETVSDLGAYANGCDADAAALKAGRAHPFTCETDQYTKNPRTYRREPVMVGWDLANDDQRARAVKKAIWRNKQEARQARSHAEMLTKLASAIHGRELIAVEHTTLAPIVIGSRFERMGATWTVRNERGRGKFTCVRVECDGSERRAHFMSREIRRLQGAN